MDSPTTHQLGSMKYLTLVKLILQTCLAQYPSKSQCIVMRYRFKIRYFGLITRSRHLMTAEESFDLIDFTDQELVNWPLSHLN